jgi:hypothetical protein
VRNAVDLAGGAIAIPAGVAVVAPIAPLDDALARGLEKPSAAPNMLEVEFRQRVNAALGVEYRLGDQRPVPAGTAVGQGAEQLARGGEPLLHAGQDVALLRLSCLDQLAASNTLRGGRVRRG